MQRHMGELDARHETLDSRFKLSFEDFSWTLISRVSRLVSKIKKIYQFGIFFNLSENQ